MNPSRHPETQAFRRLRSGLARRRLAQLEPRLRVELFLLSLLLAGFVFWQVRTPFASLSAEGGPPAVAGALALTSAVLAFLTAGFVAGRHAQRLRGGPPGPEWLGLPLDPRLLARHLAWDSGALAGWIAVPTIGVWISAFGLVPLAWQIALLPALAWSLFLASRLGTILGQRIALWKLRDHPQLDPMVRILSARTRASRPRPIRAPRWTRKSVRLAFWAKDLRVSLRVHSVRQQLLVAVLFWALSLAAWQLPDMAARHVDYAAAFVLGLLGSAALGEWLVALSGSDPFAAVRVLPVRLADIWGARFASALLATLLLVAGHALAARELSPQALRVFLVWLAGATLMISALAVNYGVTLFPRADIAQRLLGLSLGLAVAASLMVPLLGWLVLLTAVLHSARRLPHWSHLEEV